MNTTVSTAAVFTGSARTGSSPFARVIEHLRQSVAARQAKTAHRLTRDELAALHQRRLVAARLLDERHRDASIFRIL
jgi:hypothetical protein